MHGLFELYGDQSLIEQVLLTGPTIDYPALPTLTFGVWIYWDRMTHRDICSQSIDWL